MTRTTGFYLYGLPFASSEAAYMAGRTTDKETQYTISSMDLNEGGYKVKKYSKSIRLEMDERSRLKAMFSALKAKFSLLDQQELLLSFEPNFVEFNTWGDTFWGLCHDGTKWIGSNNLGKLLNHFHKILSSNGK